jgi:hypothetical protein
MKTLNDLIMGNFTPTPVKAHPNFVNTPEQKEKRRKTYRAKRDQKWREVFAKLGNTATCEQVAEVLGNSKFSVSAMFSRMVREPNPVIAVVGPVEQKFSRGNRKLLYKWIGD